MPALSRLIPKSSIPVVLARLSVLVLLIIALVEAQKVSDGGHWWNSLWYWAGLAFLIGLTTVLAWRARERRHVLREAFLQSAVSERTSDLDRQRLGERERNQILEMIVSNEPLGAVLDAVLRSVRAQCPDVGCAVLLKRGDGCQVMATLGLQVDWLAALHSSYAVPFEVWRMPLSNPNPSRDRAWKIFASALTSNAPGAILSRPISGVDTRTAAIVLLYPEKTAPREPDAAIGDNAARLVRLAMEHNRLYDDLHFQASHDSLTGLANRSLFEERLERSLREAEVLQQRIAVIFVDLDRFKQVNDTFSHRVGDLFLCRIAERMKSALQPSDTLARIGGDEFTIVVNDVKDAAEAAALADRVLQAIRQPLVIDGHEIPASASIGIALYPEDGVDAEKLQRAADAAMYCAKDLGRDRAESFGTRNETLDRARMDEELRVALREKYFVVYYQPKVGADRKLAGFEALIRMKHPVHGMIPPMAFIPAAESNGMIIPIGAWVLEEACSQLAAWEARGLHPVSVAVNVSPVQICRPDFARSVDECLKRHGVAPESLELELTESLLIDAVGVAQDQLRALRALGVRLSLDDFGSGYSSLSYLHRLPVDSIKLDRSFVQSIDTDQLAHRLVQAMIGVAQGLGLKVVAEGVETEGQRSSLLAAGCSLMQGFLFARPQPAEDLEEFLRNCDEQTTSEDDLRHLTEAMRRSSSLEIQPRHAVQPWLA